MVLMINSLFMDRGGSIAKLLMGKLEDWARERGCKGSQPTLGTLYRVCGVVIGRRRRRR